MTRKRFKKLLMARRYPPRFANACINLCRAFNRTYADAYKGIKSTWEILDAVDAGIMSTKEAMRVLGMEEESEDSCEPT